MDSATPFWFAGLSMFATAGAPTARRGTADLDAVANDVELIKALPEPSHGLVTEAFSLSLQDTSAGAV